MGECFINRRGGGGGGKLFAAISATYPAGSTCTCSNGVKTLKAEDTSGLMLFAIPEAGTWVVTATNGTNSKSESVDITTKGQTASVTLSYRLYIFQSGKGMTSGYSASFSSEYGTTSNSTSKSAITWATNAAYGGNMVIKPAINLKNYKTLYFEVDHTQQYDGGSVTVGVGSESGTSFTASKRASYSTSKQTLSVNVSSITSSLYVKTRSLQSAGRIYNIWFE